MLLTGATGTFEGCLLALCNPLLDITATVEDSFLAKYGLKPNDAILADEKHSGLSEELVGDHSVAFTAGGSGQNSMRAAQWLLPKGSTVFMGCVGDDQFGRTLKKAAEQDGLHVEYMVDETAATGTCACLITKENRSLVAALGAANNYRVDHIRQPSIQTCLERARVVYISGFFLTVSPETIMHVAGHIQSSADKILCMNLSAPFLCDVFQKPMLEALPYVDILFGNESEALAFAEKNQLGTADLHEIALRLSEWEKTSHPARPRIVLITHGERPTICAQSGKIIETGVDPIPSREIVDTNGAGDAFVGGFLSRLIQGGDLPSCIRVGHAVAGIIIRRSGVTFPEEGPGCMQCQT